MVGRGRDGPWASLVPACSLNVLDRPRLRSALIASGLELPARRNTVNLAAADLPKEGSHYDLPIALGLMAAIGAIPPDALPGFTVLGDYRLVIVAEADSHAMQIYETVGFAAVERQFGLTRRGP